MFQMFKHIGVGHGQQHVEVKITLSIAVLETLDELAMLEGVSRQDLLSAFIENSISRQVAGYQNHQLWETLTDREQEITAWVCLGYTNTAIAQELSISPATVKKHLSNLLPKFNVVNRVALRQLLDGWHFEDWLAQ